MSKKVLILVSVMAAFVLVYAYTVKAQAVSEGLVARWTFDDISGDTVPDSAGDADGTIIDGPLGTAPGAIGMALEFNGEGYVSTDSEVAELGAADFSFSFWIKTPFANLPIMIKDDGDEAWEFHEKLLYVAQSPDSEGTLTGPVEYVGWGVDWIRGSIEVHDDEWHHVAVTWDGSEGFVYTDGEEGTFEVGFNGGADNPDETVKLGIWAGAHTAERFEGLLDDFRIYERALSAGEIAEIMDDTTAVSPVSKLATTWGMIK